MDKATHPVLRTPQCSRRIPAIIPDAAPMIITDPIISTVKTMLKFLLSNKHNLELQKCIKFQLHVIKLVSNVCACVKIAKNP